MTTKGSQTTQNMECNYSNDEHFMIMKYCNSTNDIIIIDFEQVINKTSCNKITADDFL